MKRQIFDTYYIWKNEMKVIFRDPAVILLFLIVPLGYPLLYSFIYNNEVVRDAKLIVVDESNSYIARDFARRIDATPDVNIVARVANFEEGREALRRKEAYGILYIPSDFSDKAHRSEQAQVMIYSDMSSLLFYKNFLLAATEVSLEMGADIRVAEMGHKTQAEDATTMQAVHYVWVGIYNPQNGFASFFVPAILILIIQQTLILGVGTIIGTHNDRKTFTVASHAQEGRSVSAVWLTIGKAIAYMTVYLVSSVWVLRVVPYMFSLPQIGDPLTLFVFLVPFLLACSFFAMTLSYFVSQREFVMLLFVFTSVIFVFMSGVSWPWITIPSWIQALGYIVPSTPGIHGFIRINTMGVELSDVWFEFVTLWLHAIGYCITAILMYKWWIANYDPVYKGRKPQKKSKI